jgi:molecular chaperone DnaJ
MAAQREWFEKDYYKILGVPDSASAKEITRAYRKLARENHPDAKPGDASAEERFKEISAAYDVIGDAEKRKEYDEVRKLGPVGAGFGGGFGHGGFGAGGPGGPGGGYTFTFDEGDAGGLGDILGGLFGRGRRGARGASRGPGPQRGADLETELHLSFEDAVSGVTTAVHLTSEAICHTCHGSGAKPGTTPHTCPRCGGRGVLDDNQGLFSFSQPCPQCAGRGVVVDDPCPTCHGSGIEQRPREVKVRIPAGVTDGKRIRLKGRGGPGRNGGPPGDLYVITRVAPHPMFRSDGRNLSITVPITYPEAALGADIRVPTIDGGSVTLRVPPGTRSGRTFRVKGRGVEMKKGMGDLLVTTEVTVPKKLSAAERKALEALAAAQQESPRNDMKVGQ